MILALRPWMGLGLVLLCSCRLSVPPAAVTQPETADPGQLTAAFSKKVALDFSASEFEGVEILDPYLPLSDTSVSMSEQNDQFRLEVEVVGNDSRLRILRRARSGKGYGARVPSRCVCPFDSNTIHVAKRHAAIDSTGPSLDLKGRQAAVRIDESIKDIPL